MSSYIFPQNFKVSPERYDPKWNNESSGYQPIGFTRQDVDYRGESFSDHKIINNSKPIILLNIAGEILQLSPQLNEIGFAIDESRTILELEEGWDGYDAEKVNMGTWKNAVLLLASYAKFILDNFQAIIKAPEINPGRDGSIDLVWRTSTARLLINVRPSGGPILASYYGDLYDNKQAIKNPIENNSIVEHLAFWMKNLA